MYEIKENQEVKITFKYGHISYTMKCPLCKYESEFQCGKYPTIVKCPYCKSQLEIKKSFNEKIAG